MEIDKAVKETIYFVHMIWTFCDEKNSYYHIVLEHLKSNSQALYLWW